MPLIEIEELESERKISLWLQSDNTNSVVPAEIEQVLELDIDTVFEGGWLVSNTP